MKHKLALSLFSMALAATASNAFAGGAALLGGSGGSNMSAGSLYGGGSLGQATTNCMMADYQGVEEDCSTMGWKAFGGYKFTDMIAVEAGYYALGESDESLADDDLTVNVPDGKDGFIEQDVDSIHATGKANGIGLMGVVTMPVMDKLEVMGKAGVMKWSSEAETHAILDGKTIDGPTEEVDSTGFLWGIGAAYQLTNNWGVRGEYESFTREDIYGEEHDVGIVSAGATYSTF